MSEESLIEELSEDIVENNGEGHKRLQKRVDEGEITEAVAEIIKLRANIKLLSSCINSI